MLLLFFIVVPAKPRTLSTSSSEESSSFLSLPPSNANMAGSLDLTLRRLSHGEEYKEGCLCKEELETEKDVRLLTETASFRNDWFSVVGTNEHSSTEKYVQEKVGEDFGHSTDSSSSNDNGLHQIGTDFT